MENVSAHLLQSAFGLTVKSPKLTPFLALKPGADTREILK
jgi:hypothetical protein